jgi:hypothetical protein
MQKYIRDKSLFQTERDKGKKINTQTLDIEFSNLSKYIDSVISYINTIERGNFVGKQGYNNYLFKNKGNVVVLEPIENVSLKYTFSNYRNSFFIYNSNYQANVYSFNILNNNRILKYYNNNFLFDTIRTEDFTINSIAGNQKIDRNTVDISKIQNFDTFFVNQTKFLYKDNQIQNIIASGTEGLEYAIDVSTSFFLVPQKFTDYLNVDTAVGAWFDYIKKNKFSVQKKIEPYINTVAETPALLQKIEFGVNLVYSTGCPINTISPKSVTDIALIYQKVLLESSTNIAGLVIHGTYRDENSADPKYFPWVQPISSVEWYFHKMFWGQKQIKSRHFPQNYNGSLFYNKNSQLWWFTAPTGSFTFVIRSTAIASNYKIRHNYHIADGCFEPRHFCDNSISLNSIAKNNRAKIPLSKFNRAFMTRLGL